MLSTRRSPRQPAVARRKAAVRSSGASRPTRKAEDSSSTLQSSSGPIVVTTPALLTRVACAKRAPSRAASQSCRRAATPTGSARSACHCSRSRRCCAATRASAAFVAPGDAEHRVPGVGEQLLGQRRAHAARRAGDDEQLQAACGQRAVRLLDAGDRPLAAAVGRLHQVPDFVEGLGDAVGLLADQAVEADADDLPIGLAGDVEHFGVDADDVGALRRRAALLQVEPDRGEHLRRGEGAQVLEVAGVVGRLQADEDHLGDALEAFGVEARGQARAVALRRERRAAAAHAAWGSRRTGCRGAPAPANCRRAVTAGGFRAEAAQQEADREEGDAGEQHEGEDVAERLAEAEVAHQRGDAEAGGEAGDRAEPGALAARRRARRRGGRAGGLAAVRPARGRFGRGPRRHAALHAGRAAAADASGKGVAGHRGGRDQGDCESDDERLHSFSG